RDGDLNLLVLQALIIDISVMSISLAVATSLASLTYRGIRETTSLSAAYRAVEQKLLIAVCAQTFVPTLCVYIPYFFTEMVTFLGLPGIGLIDFFPVVVTLFPFWDALVITLIIKDYRFGLMKIMGWKPKQKVNLIVS
ncbi:hypothetical protein PFISCL1PPCAC_14373, partial [Pristionchus fissidentatus]